MDFGRTPGSIVKTPSRAYPMEEDTGEIKVAVESYTRGGATIGGYGEWDEQGNSLTFPGVKRDPNVYNQPNFSETSSTPFPGQSRVFNSSAITPPSNQGAAQPQSAIPAHGPDLRGTGPTTGPVGLQGAQRTIGNSRHLMSGNSSTPAGGMNFRSNLPAYDPSDRVDSYSSAGKPPDQALPGLLGSPFGSQIASQVQQYGGGLGGAFALGAALDPNAARGATSSITTDARIGGLSNAFYDTHQRTTPGAAGRDAGSAAGNTIGRQWQDAGNASNAGGQSGGGHSPEFIERNYPSGGGQPGRGGQPGGGAEPAPSEMDQVQPGRPGSLPEDAKSPSAGQGNTFEYGMGNNDIFRYGVGAAGNQVVKRLGGEAAKQTVKQTIGRRALTERPGKSLLLVLYLA